MNTSSLVVASSLLVAAFSLGTRLAPKRGPVVIDLQRPGDALAITCKASLSAVYASMRKVGWGFTDRTIRRPP